MRTRYKNKRDFYKAEMERAKGDLVRKQIVLDDVSRQFREYKEKQEKNKKERYSAHVFCTNCLEVHSVSIPNGVKVANGDCVNCRVRSSEVHQTLFLVSNKVSVF